MEEITPCVAVLTVTYGKRWHFLSQVVEAVMKDRHVITFVIVDNGSHNKEEILDGVKHYGNRVVVIRLEKNVGSAGGFAQGIEYAKGIDCEYIFMLDDDNVPETDAIEKFLDIKKKISSEKVVLVGNRINIPGNEEVFYQKYIAAPETKGTFFDVFSFKKIENFLKLFKTTVPKIEKVHAVPHEYVPNESFVYGGAFIPMDAVRSAPLPDRDLILYGDDIEYSWGIKRLGYESYVCFSPKIYDIEMSFGEGSQVGGLFSPETRLYRFYFRIRNMVRISVRNTKQNQMILFANVVAWALAFSVFGIIKYGLGKNFFEKFKLLVLAIYGGYVQSARIPPQAQLP